MACGRARQGCVACHRESVLSVPNFQGPKAIAEIAKGLLTTMGLSEQPADFQQLYALLKARTKR